MAAANRRAAALPIDGDAPRARLRRSSHIIG